MVIVVDCLRRPRFGGFESNSATPKSVSNPENTGETIQRVSSLGNGRGKSVEEKRKSGVGESRFPPHLVFPCSVTSCTSLAAGSSFLVAFRLESGLCRS